jgi:hypothetical protein
MAFKKGQSGNPSGKPKLPDDLAHLMRATGEQIKRDLCVAYNLPHKDLQALANQPEASSGFKMIASCMDNGIQVGDNRILATILDRLIGKPKETLEVSGTETNGFKIVVEDYTKK